VSSSKGSSCDVSAFTSRQAVRISASVIRNSANLLLQAVGCFFSPLILALFLWYKSPTRTQAASFFWSLGHTRLDTHTHTHTHTHLHTQGRTPLNDGSACHRGRYLHNRQQTQRTNIHVLNRIRTHNPSKQAASDLALHRTAPESAILPLLEINLPY
jgi:hypothetical protein